MTGEAFLTIAVGRETHDRFCKLMERIGDTGSDELVNRALDALDPVDRDDWPVHQPGPAYEAPIPGTHWYGGCDPDYPRVDPLTGRCEGCDEQACVECGRSNCPDHAQVTA